MKKIIYTFLLSLLTLSVFSQNVEVIGNRMVELMNESRATESLNPLVLNPHLNEAAKIQAEFLNTLNFDSKRFSHKNPNPLFLKSSDRVMYVLNSHDYTGHIISIGENITFEYFNDGDPYSELPLDVEWCPELSFWDTPWWFRNDVVTFDKIAEDETSYSKWIDSNERAEIIGLSIEIFNEIEKQFTQEIKNIGLGEIIEVDFSKKFKPTVVD